MGEYTYVLGISAFYHDSAAALLRDGEIVAAAQEERFTRKKNDQEFPRHAARYCLRESGLSIEDVQLVAFYERHAQLFGDEFTHRGLTAAGNTHDDRGSHEHHSTEVMPPST